MFIKQTTFIIIVTLTAEKHIFAKEVKRALKGEPSHSSIVEVISFQQDEVERLDLLKKHFGLEDNKAAIKALIEEKCAAIKLAKEQERKQQIENAKAMAYLEKGQYIFPMYE